MSFDIKNIEQEGINYKMIAPVGLLFVIGIAASLVFVYYYFTFEKDYIMHDQYLGAKSKIKENYYKGESEKLNALNIDLNKKNIILEYANTIDKALKNMQSLQEQLLSY